MDNMELIESYFGGTTTEEQKSFFEGRILDDAEFANDVAFYISANEVLKQELLEQKQQQFREIYNREKKEKKVTPVITLWRYLAAAAVVGLIAFVSWFLIGNKPAVEQLAGSYIEQNFQELHGTMGVQDSLQLGIELFNAHKFPEGLSIFQKLNESYPGDDEVKKYAGITSLRMEDYDKAIHYFSLLETDTTLYSNPGKFYKAIARLKRNGTGDKDQAKKLLQEVVDQNLEGRKEAEEWLKSF